MLTLVSPAKINLFLRIVQRRPDGYHDLASLFQAISLFDTIHLSLSDRDDLSCSDPSLPTDDSNLILKAAHLFRRKTGLKFGLKAFLEKRIPCQAGLGGGSGNAATTLWGLNQLCGHPASIDELSRWSSEIGSDISFFFSCGTAYCTGRGENVQPLDPLPSTHLWVVKPPLGLSTPAVYGRLNVAQLKKLDPESSLRSFLEGRPHYYNDLEGAAFAAMPALQDLKQQLSVSGFDTVMMSGSGSAFFCIGRGVPPKNLGLNCYSVRFLNRTSEGWYKI